MHALTSLLLGCIAFEKGRSCAFSSMCRRLLLPSLHQFSDVLERDGLRHIHVHTVREGLGLIFCTSIACQCNDQTVLRFVGLRH